MLKCNLIINNVASNTSLVIINNVASNTSLVIINNVASNTSLVICNLMVNIFINKGVFEKIPDQQ